MPQNIKNCTPSSILDLTQPRNTNDLIDLFKDTYPSFPQTIPFRAVNQVNKTILYPQIAIKSPDKNNKQQNHKTAHKKWQQPSVKAHQIVSNKTSIFKALPKMEPHRSPCGPLLGRSSTTMAPSLGKFSLKCSPSEQMSDDLKSPTGSSGGPSGNVFPLETIPSLFCALLWSIIQVSTVGSG